MFMFIGFSCSSDESLNNVNRAMALQGIVLPIALYFSGVPAYPALPPKFALSQLKGEDGRSPCATWALSHLSGSNDTPLVSCYSFHATLCRIFCLTFSQCRTRIALHPLKCLKKGPVAPVCGVCGGGWSHLNFAISRSCVTVQGMSQTQCCESRCTAPLGFSQGTVSQGVLCKVFLSRSIIHKVARLHDTLWHFMSLHDKIMILRIQARAVAKCHNKVLPNSRLGRRCLLIKMALGFGALDAP